MLTSMEPGSTDVSVLSSSWQDEEMKGKERKGKERKGKERKGKERNGKERKGGIKSECLKK
jgi:hypothetical protein